MAEGMDEGEAGEGEKKKGGTKKLIIKIVPLILIALIVAKMTVLKPAPPTAAQAAAKATATKLALDAKCALANDMKAPKQAAAAAGTAKTDTTAPTTPTSTTKPELKGPVLELESKTMNLDGTHFLKIGISLQLPAKAVPDTVKTTENWSSIASQLVLDTFSGRSFAELSNDGLRQRLQHQIGNDVCEKTGGEVETLYFIDFVMQ